MQAHRAAAGASTTGTVDDGARLPALLGVVPERGPAASVVRRVPRRRDAGMDQLGGTMP